MDKLDEVVITANYPAAKKEKKRNKIRANRMEKNFILF